MTTKRQKETGFRESPIYAHATATIAALRAENERLRASLHSLAAYAAAEIGVPLAECVAGPIGEARAALESKGSK